MKKFYNFVLPFVIGLVLVLPSHGQTLAFELLGIAEPGISFLNEPGGMSGGTGGIGPGGLTFNFATRILSTDLKWGSANGFIDLSSDVDFMNLHGPTASQAPLSFVENGAVLTGLEGFNPSATSGGFVGDIEIPQSEVVRLLEGRFYFHLHTFDHNNGEARGYAVPLVVVGDVDGNGLINLLDVAPFVAVLSSGVYQDEADINRDGAVNLLDVNPFVSLLSG